MRNCYVCTRELSTPFNLRRHLRLCHNIQTPLRVGKTKTMERVTSYQTGGGLDSDVSDEESIASDGDISDAEESSSDDGNENWVFDRFLQKINTDEECDLKQSQELFRKIYTDFLIWYHYLKQNTIHKKIMETVMELETSGYDKEEALQAAVEQRKFLLDPIVESQSTMVEEEDDDEEEDDV